jgi:hypothetical protein
MSQNPYAANNPSFRDSLLAPVFPPKKLNSLATNVKDY